MTQFASFIAGEPIVSGLPSDWTQEEGTFTAQVVADATTSGVADRILNTSADTVSGNISWNTPGSLTDQEVLSLTKITGPTVNTSVYVIASVRMQTGALAGYVLGATANGVSGGITYNVGVYPAATVVGNTPSFTWSSGTWYWARLRTSGTTFTGKMWALGTAEPDWAIVGIDATWASGKTGSRLQVAGTNIAFFSAASGTDSAPSVPGKMVVPK